MKMAPISTSALGTLDGDQDSLRESFWMGSWFLFPATEKHIFHASPEKLWQQLLREMGGKYASLSMIPEDLSLN